MSSSADDGDSVLHDEPMRTRLEDQVAGDEGIRGQIVEPGLTITSPAGNASVPALRLNVAAVVERKRQTALQGRDVETSENSVQVPQPAAMTVMLRRW
jgi:hypothetical protein